MDGLPESFSGLLVVACLVVHQSEVRSDFGDFRMEGSSLPVEISCSLKVTPGLGLLRRGKERFEYIRLLRENYPRRQAERRTAHNSFDPEPLHTSPVKLQGCLHEPR